MTTYSTHLIHLEPTDTLTVERNDTGLIVAATVSNTGGATHHPWIGGGAGDRRGRRAALNDPGRGGRGGHHRRGRAVLADSPGARSVQWLTPGGALAGRVTVPDRASARAIAAGLLVDSGERGRWRCCPGRW